MHKKIYQKLQKNIIKYQVWIGILLIYTSVE